MEQLTPPKIFSAWRIYVVLAICISLSGFIFYTEFSKHQLDFSKINFTSASLFFLLTALLMMVFRDLAYIVRIRLLTKKALTWKQSFNVILLWEFASALTPGVVGGAAVAMFILRKEKINLGKSTAIVIITALFDNLFYVVLVPIVFLFISASTLFPSDLDWLKQEGLAIFYSGFALLFLITIILFVSVFVYPKLIGKLLSKISKLPLLKRKKEKLHQLGVDVELASKEFKRESFLFWCKIFLVTIWSWLSRYLVINFILLAFIEIGFLDNFIVLARQLVIWLVMLVSPTPGGSGVAEFLFGQLLSDFIKNGAFAISLALLWRLISYYPYLLFGSIILPSWLVKK